MCFQRNFSLLLGNGGSSACGVHRRGARRSGGDGRDGSRRRVAQPPVSNYASPAIRGVRCPRRAALVVEATVAVGRVRPRTARHPRAREGRGVWVSCPRRGASTLEKAVASSNRAGEGEQRASDGERRDGRASWEMSLSFFRETMKE